jgi:hypothetical protein
MGRKKVVRKYKRAKKAYIPDGPPKLIPCTVEVPRVKFKGKLYRNDVRFQLRVSSTYTGV